MQSDATAQDKKTGPEPAQKNRESVSPERARFSARSLPKTHVGFWRARVERRTYDHNGQTFEVPAYSVPMEFGGIRKRLTLGSALKEEAALKARDIYLSLVAKGWSATLAELAPKTVHEFTRSEHEPTVGEFISEVERTAGLKPKTFRRYAQSFRMMAAQIHGLKADASRFDYHGGGLTRWRDRVNAIPLTDVTPASVADWKIGYLKRAGSDPRRRLEVNRAFNAALRNCKSLFSGDIINKPNFTVRIPKFMVPDGQSGKKEAYWFQTVAFEPAGSMKFRAPAGITYEGLLTNARDELRAEHPESYKLLLMCLCAGLRRAEADVCLWTQLNPKDNSIQIESNEFIDPKHGSGGTVYFDPLLMRELQSFKGDNSERFVVNSPRAWKLTVYDRYRCEPHWRKLQAWLEGKGIHARKKVHELRKIFGDAIVKQNGIFAGSAQLRHATIQMTASHYTDPRQRAALPVGSLFADESPASTTDAEIQQPASAEKTHRKRQTSGVSIKP